MYTYLLEMQSIGAITCNDFWDERIFDLSALIQETLTDSCIEFTRPSFFLATLCTTLIFFVSTGLESCKHSHHHKWNQI